MQDVLVSDSASAQALIEELTRDEQAAHAAMKLAHERKLEVLKQIDEQARINAELRRQQVAAQAAELKELSVLGISYSKLRTRMKVNGLRCVLVHKDILKLLRAALPAVDEEQFYQLITTLFESLVYKNVQAKEAVQQLKDNKDTARYFEESDEFVGLPLVLTGRYAGGRRELLSEFLTAYALSWGQATEYEGEQADV